MLSQPDNFYEFFVNVEKFTQIGTLKEIYAKRVGEPVESLRLRYKGHKGPDLRDTSTPKSLKMKEGDVIKVYKCITIGVQDPFEAELRILTSLSMKCVKESFAKHFQLDVSKFEFMYNAKEVNAFDTPDSLEMKENDTMSVKILMDLPMEAE